MTNEQNDFLSWLMDKAEGEENEDGALLERVLTINFVAIHTTASVGHSTLCPLQCLLIQFRS